MLGGEAGDVALRRAVVGWGGGDVASSWWWKCRIRQEFAGDRDAHQFLRSACAHVIVRFVFA